MGHRKFEETLICDWTSKSAVVSEPSASPVKPSNNSRRKRKRKRNSLGPALTPTSAISASHALQEKTKRKMKRNFNQNNNNKNRSDVIPKSCGSDSVSSLSQCKRKITKGSSRSYMISKSPESDSVSSSSQSKTKIKKGVIKSASVPRSSTSTSSLKKSHLKITKKDQNMHRLIFEKGGLPDDAKVGYYNKGKKLLDGYIKERGIFCFCCNSVVTASQFEAHAGCATRRKPYNYIYTSNGVSLHEYAISLLKSRKRATKENDELCMICEDDGNLLLCDGCPRAFHKECVDSLSFAHGKLYCKHCMNMFERDKFVERNINASAAGRRPGVDPLQEIAKLRIQILKNPQKPAIACFLCRGYEYNEKGPFGPNTVVICDQCEKEYHVGCLKNKKMANLMELPNGRWYCSKVCKKMRSELKKLVVREPQILPDNLMDLMRKKEIDNGLDGITDSDLRWRLLNGQISSHRTKSLLSEAVAIFHECFDPIIDPESGKDFIPAMVYCKSTKNKYFGGMYTAVLTVDSIAVSVAILRVFVHHLAELPLVATSKSNQGKGYFQRLFACIEKLLISLKVKRIILPAADEAEALWINKFGFAKLSPQQLAKSRKNCSAMFRFEGTSMLGKELPV